MLTPEYRHLLKQAFGAPLYAGGQPIEQKKPDSGVPWGKMLLGAGALAGGAYAHGRIAQNSPLQGFSSTIDRNIVNPISSRISNYMGGQGSTANEMDGIKQRVDDGGFYGQFKGIKNESQLHGTEFYNPNNIQRTMDDAGAIAGAGSLGTLVGSAVTKGSSAAGGAFRKAAPVLGAISSLPSSMQLGDKINDAAGIQNNMARNVIKGTTMAGSTGVGTLVGRGLGKALGAVGGFLPGAYGRVAKGAGNLIGNTLGASTPTLVNNTINDVNNIKMTMNGVSGRADALQNEFARAMAAKGDGNNNPLAAWYGMHKTPEQLKMTMDQYKSNPELQRQITANRPL